MLRIQYYRVRLDTTEEIGPTCTKGLGQEVAGFIWLGFGDTGPRLSAQILTPQESDEGGCKDEALKRKNGQVPECLRMMTLLFGV